MNMNARFGKLTLISLMAFAFALMTVRADIQTWMSVGTGDWFSVVNWTNTVVPAATRVPADGDGVVITNSNAFVCLTQSSARLSSMLISNATVACSNWETTIYATNLTIQNCGVLTCVGPFTNNVMSNRVSLNCSDIFIEANGSINVDGKGFAGGTGSYATGNGPGGGSIMSGAGYGGAGVNGMTVVFQSNTYGSVTLPLDPGSGGSGGSQVNSRGGAGGGAVCITSVHVVVNGRISADAGPTVGVAHNGGGSGGGINISCVTITGTNGAITANAGNPQGDFVNCGGGAGGGRIAVIYDTVAQRGISMPSIRFSAASTRSGGMYTYIPGDIGTLYFPDSCLFSPTNLYTGQWMAPGLTNLALSDWVVSNVWLRLPAINLTVTNTLVIAGTNYDLCRLEITNNPVINCGQILLSGAALNLGNNYLPIFPMNAWGGYNTSGPTLHCSDNLVLTNASRFYISAGLTNNGAEAGCGARVNVDGDILVASNCWILPAAHATNGAVVLFNMRNLTLDFGGGFDANNLGYAGGIYPGDGSDAMNAAFGPGATVWNGGSGYGGSGANGYYGAGGAVYGSSNAPVDPGSGVRAGACSRIDRDGHGGGSVQIRATDTVAVNGAIKADGGMGSSFYGAGASGGGIYIVCRTFVGDSNGVLQANGGDWSGGSAYGGGGGGGGRIAVWRWLDNSTSVISNYVNGGLGWGGGTSTNAAESGTIVWGWLGPLDVISQPQSLTNNPGQSATFSIQVSDAAPLRYQWLKDNVIIENRTSSNYTITSILKSDEGNYRCVVINMDRSVTSSVASLTVNDPPAITVNPQSQTNNPDSSVMFQLTTVGTAPFCYQWQKNMENINGANSSNYSIAVVAQTDEGDYRCIVTNIAGATTSSVASLTVNAPPVITVNPQSQTNNPDSSVMFQLTTVGTAPLCYQWQKNMENINGANSSNYTIAVVAQADEGDYRCIVTNIAGVATSSVASLAVNDPPVITVNPQSQTNNPDSSVMFQLTTVGTAPLCYQWQKNMENINGANSSNYTIAVVAQADEGDYRCIVTNIAGVATSSVACLTVNDPPAAPTGLSASDGAYTNKVALTWHPAEDVTGYRIFRHTSNNSADAEQIGDAASTKYDDVGAVAGTFYYYWVKSTNSAGVSEFSSYDVGQRSAAVEVPAAPANVHASDGTYTDKVRVTWSASSGAIRYEVWRHTLNNSALASKVPGPDPTMTSYDDTGVTAGTSYYYWVKAVNAIGAGRFSNPNSGYAAVNQTPSSNADLALSSLVLLPNRLRAGDHPGILAVVLVNNGPGSLALLNARIVIDVYLSLDTTLGNDDDLWLGDYQMDVNLGAGSRTTISASGANREQLTIPSNVSGRYYVFAKVRHAAPSTLVDPNLVNNIVMRADTIKIDTSKIVYHPINDYDGDGMSDMVLYELATGFWYVQGSSMGFVSAQFGDDRFLPCAGDFDGDGKSDYLIYTGLYGGNWMVYYSENQTIGALQGGGLGYVPLRGDFDGDGLSDFGVYEESTGNWITVLSASGQVDVRFFGAEGYDHVAGDFDGDGRTDPALYHASGSYWFWLPAGAQMPDFQYAQLGWPDSTPVPGDYDGDGTTDLAVYHPSYGWKIRNSSGGELELSVAISGQPVIGDYDGDGKVDICIYLPASGLWLIKLSTTGQVITLQFGAPGCSPVQ